jgi:aminopeptidase-like protein
VDLSDLRARLAVEDIGQTLHTLIERLFPICRSITGDGVRETLTILAERLPLEIHEVPSGTPVLDWTVPPEWNIRAAYLDDPSGHRVVDFADSNLHVVGYSAPVRATMSLTELRPHLHSLPDRPNLIPFRTSFYREDWGFCLTDEALQALPDGDYEVCIDSSLTEGSLSYGELVVPGQTDAEILVSSHVCHPSLCNDNLSGIAIATLLAESLLGSSPRHTYRFVFAPVTIGAITWLARNEQTIPRIVHGLVLTLLGDAGDLTYKRSRRGDATIDRAVEHVLRTSGAAYSIENFSPYGYDERQYCSPGFDLPVGCLMRTPYARFPEYHTSGDDLAFVQPAQLEASLATCLAIVDVLERDGRFVNLSPKGEPQLGRRGIYRALADRTDDGLEMAMLWVLNLSDGHHSLLDIADRADLPFTKVRRAADILVAHDLLAPSPEP